MAISFPTSLDTLTNPAAGDSTSTVSHSSQHANANDAIEALEAKVGVNSSAVTSSLDYKVTNTSSLDPGHKHTPTVSLAITGTPDGTKFLRDDNTWSDPPTAAEATTSTTGLVLVSTTPGGTATAVETGDPRVPTQNENDALVGTSGTAVSSSNKLVDAADVSDAAASGKIVRATGTALPALSAQNLTFMNAAFSASDTLQQSADTERSGTDTSYVIKKEVRVRRDGTIRVKFGLKGTNGINTVFGRVYVNGSAIGTEHSTTSSSYQTYSDDITVVRQDLVQLYAYTSVGANTYYVNNFRIYYDLANTADTVVNTD